MLLLLRFFLIIHKTLILQGFRLLWNKNKRDRKMRNTWTHLMVSDTFYFIVDDIVFCPKDDKPYCPLTCTLLKLFPKEVSSNRKCWFDATFHHIYFIKCYSFHIVFKNFSSKLVAILPYCSYEIHGRYNLLLLLKTNNQMWLAGA